MEVRGGASMADADAGETSHHFDVVKPFDAVKTSSVRSVSRRVLGRKRRREMSEEDRAGRGGTGGRRAVDV